MTGPQAPPSGRIALPVYPDEPAGRPFPLLASLAPVVVSVLMWAVTQSPFALVFAVLGPVIAVAGLVDDRRSGRRRHRSQKARFSRELDAAFAAIEAEHAIERQELDALAVHPSRLAVQGGRDPEWWRGSWDQPVTVCLGRGSISSRLRLDVPAGPAADGIPEQYERLRAAASRLADAPVLVDARHGIGIVGSDVPATALARAIATQLAFRLSPAGTAVGFDDARFAWAARLPHRRLTDRGEPNGIVFEGVGMEPAAGRRIVCVVAAREDRLPRDCRIVIRLEASGIAVLTRNPSGGTPQSFHPWYLSDPQCAILADTARVAAADDGLVPAADELPESVALAGLEPAAPVRNRLPARFAVADGRPLSVDLVEDGPHAVVAGTTGSGKSELLISWVLALAETNGPEAVNFLLVDFKGGSSFGAVSRLPHTVGLITDLDQESAHRALLSLRAELRHRESVLAEAQARSIADLDGANRMPRLVIVVDEFAVVVSDFPELQGLFSDLAARGRSLGVHLILCTQRPTGVIRDSVLANCSLRLSLRVNNGADSTAVIGTADAAGLGLHPSGRCYLSVGGAGPVAAQVALACTADADRVSQKWGRPGPPVRRPWCEPLPAMLEAGRLRGQGAGAGLTFGLSDVPERQSQPAADYEPERDGNLVILGGHRSGKSGMLAALAAASRLPHAACATELVPPDVEGSWDVVVAAAARLVGDSGAPILYLIDDVDSLLGRLGDDHRLAFIEIVTRLMREGPARGIRVALTAARVSSGLQPLVTQCDSRLILRLPNREEHLLAGGEGQGYRGDLPPGRGTWRGHPVQIARVPMPERRPWQGRADLPLSGPFAVVAPDAAGIAGMVTSCLPAGTQIVDIAAEPATALEFPAGGRTQVLVGDPAAWQSRWGALAAARAAGPVLFAGCSVADFRSLTGLRQLPPLLGPEPGGAWILQRGGALGRIQLPTGRQR